MAKYIITGGAGFIGSNIARELVRRGETVKVIDNLSTGFSKNLKDIKDNITFVKGDIRNLALLEKEFKGFDFVLHQAALRSVPKSFDRPKDFNNVNINGTLAVLEAAVKNKIKRVVMASSSSVYGDAKVFPLKETMATDPVSPYALTKLTNEYYCRIFSETYGLSTVCLRYFNVFGPYQSLESEYAVVIPKFISLMSEGKRPTVHGDGTQSRDFSYIDNVVLANILAATQGKITHEVFNVANGKEHSLLDMIKELNKIFKTEIKPTFLPKRQGDINRTIADISKAKKLINYKPKVEFTDGLAKTVDWFLANAKK
jgi:nucleoside-diphosphate-sugar epimerase